MYKLIQQRQLELFYSDILDVRHMQLDVFNKQLDVNISVAKSGILSRDLGIFWSSWDFYFFLFLKVNLGIFFGFFEKGKFEI
jgi:hypothetical protein